MARVPTQWPILQTRASEGEQGQKILDTRKLKPGIYFFSLNVSELSRAGKIIISK
jgi:hypothetical protein